MNRSARLGVLAATLLGVALGLPAQAGEGKKAARKADVVMPAGSLKWEDGPAKGTHVVKLWGDMAKGGPYGVLVKFDAGTMHPLHKHTQDLKIVMLSGTFSHQPEGGDEVKLGAGSYLLQRAGENHISGCADECTFFMTSKDKFDLIPKEKAEEKK